VAMRMFALTREVGPAPSFVQRTFGVFTLERGVMLGILLFVAGAGCIGLPVFTWVRAEFGDLELGRTLRPMIVGSVLIALGAETVLMSFVLGMLRMGRPE
jgi:hypothetical protein